MSGLGAAWVAAWIADAAREVAEERQELNGLDREVGDGDHGENLDRGMRAAAARLDAEPAAVPGAALRTVATTLISTVGGAAGPLLGTAFLRAAAAAGDAPELDGAAVARLLEAAAGGVAERGRAAPGDKTMLDAWVPAASAAVAAAGAGATPAAVLRAAAQAAHAGAHDTVPLVARRGRASYLGERAAGFPDPGAVSSALLLDCAADAAERADGPDTGDRP